MQQLELFEYRRDCLFDSKNQIAHYFDILKETEKTISYAEHIEPKSSFAIAGMSYEEYVDINKNLLITYSNGCKFTGMTKKDPKDKKKLIPHGLGYAIWPDGQSYRGQYKNGTFGSWCHYVSPGSHEFIGIWKKGYFSSGEMKNEDGQHYTGEFKMSKMHGEGTMNFSGNYTYEGQWKDGDAHGKGKLTYLKKFEQHEKGKVMKGNFYKGRWHGNFTISYSDGEVNKVKYNMGDFVKELK